MKNDSYITNLVRLRAEMFHMKGILEGTVRLAFVRIVQFFVSDLKTTATLIVTKANDFAY